MSSEKLGHNQNILKGELGGGFDILSGSTGEQVDLGLARRFGGAAAAYSLRDIGAMNGKVVKVRRESDDAVDNFSAGAVASGGIESFAIGQDVLDLYNNSVYYVDDADYYETGSKVAMAGAFTLSAKFVFTGTFSSSTSRLFQEDNAHNYFWIKENRFTYRIDNQTEKHITLNTSTTIKKNTLHTITISRDASDIISIAIDGVTQTNTSADNSPRNDSGTVEIDRFGFRLRGIVRDINWNDQFITTGTGVDNSNWLDTSGNDNHATGKKTGGSITRVAFTGQGISAFVDTWYDQSGNGKDATQSTTDDQPYIIQNGAIVKDTNLLPAIQWEWKSTTDGRHLDINGDTGVDVTSAISIVNTPSTASGSEDYRAFYGKQAENLQFLRQQQANRKFYLAKPSFTTGQITGNSDLLDIASIVSYNRSGSTNTIKLSSTSTRSVTVASDLDEAINFDRLGSRKDKADNHNGKWQEVIFYSRDLGDDEDTIIKELASNYKITLV